MDTTIKNISIEEYIDIKKDMYSEKTQNKIALLIFWGLLPLWIILSVPYLMFGAWKALKNS